MGVLLYSIGPCALICYIIGMYSQQNGKGISIYLWCSSSEFVFFPPGAVVCWARSLLTFHFG